MYASGTMRRINTDGSRNVFCPRCKEFIGTVTGISPINTAICVICQAADEGIELTPAQVAELRAVKMGTNVLSLAAVTPLYVADPVTGKDPNSIDVEMNTVGRYFRAIKRVATEVVKEIKSKARRAPASASKQVAKDNKRKRIFDQDIDEE